MCEYILVTENSEIEKVALGPLKIKNLYMQRTWVMGGEPQRFEKYSPNRLRDASDIFDELQWALKLFRELFS